MSATLTPNAYLGLWEGPIDNKASSVINAIVDPNSTIELTIGFPVFIKSPPSSQLLPVVDEIINISQIPLFYGILVGGDAKGIYPRAGDGFFPLQTPDNPVIAFPGQGVRVCTQGRCVAQVVAIISEINVGDPLTVIASSVSLGVATSSDLVVARALQFVAKKTSFVRESYAAVDVQREGKLP